MRRIIVLFALICSTVAVFAQIERSGKLVEVLGKKYYLHKVEAKQTMYAISKSYGVGIASILASNHKKTADLQIGEVLRIPYAAPETVVQNLTYKHYIVEKGDTLYALARRFKTTKEELARLNAGVEVALIEGRHLIVPIVSEPQVRYDQQHYYHVVKAGETLSAIARRYGMKLRHVKKNNRDLNPDKLKPGDEVRIPRENARTEIAKVRNINKKTGGELEVFIAEKDADRIQGPLTRIPKSWVPTPYEPYEEGVYSGFALDEMDNFIPNKKDEYSMLLLLPLKNSFAGMLNYYRGMLLAFEENTDLPIKIKVVDTERNIDKTQRILAEQGEVDFIVGPYTEQMFTAALPYANKNTTLVSLLSKNTTVYRNPYVLQLNTTEKTINYTIAKYVVDEHIQDNVILFDGERLLKYESGAEGRRDKISRLAAQINAYKDNDAYLTYDFKEALETLVNPEAKNVFVVPASKQRVINKVLGQLSVYNGKDIEVLGYYKWKLFPNMDEELLFNLNVIYFTPFHYLASEKEKFVVDYEECFQSYPDDFSYMGYRTMQKLLEGIREGGANFYQRPLQNILKHQDGGYENMKLYKVQYQKDYKISAN